MSTLAEPQWERRFAPRRRPARRGIVRAILILSLEFVAVASFILHDAWLATMLQLLVVLVAYVDRLDRRLPGGLQQRDDPRPSAIDS